MQGKLEKSAVVTDNLNLADKLLQEIAYPQARTEYLNALVAKELPIILGLSGITCAGKSTIADQLKAAGLQQATKLIPRPNRSGENGEYKPWINVESLPHTNALDLSQYDITPPNGIVLGDAAFAGIYAIPINDIVEKFLAGIKSSVILGRAEENYLFLQGVSEILPLAPAASLQLMVPISILRQRASAGRSGPELQQRLQAIQDFELSDQKQLRALTSTLMVRTLLNISATELNEFRFDKRQVQPLTPDFLLNCIQELEEEAKTASSMYAKDLLLKRTLSFNSPQIPKELIEVLQDQFTTALDKNNLTPLICGGLSVAIYLQNAGKTIRQVSADIDFIVPQDHKVVAEKLGIHREKRLSQAIFDITGKSGNIRDGGWNPEYLTRQDKTSVTASTGVEVELDCLVDIRLLPGNSIFCYELPMDSHASFFRREVSLPNGATSYLAPREHIIVDKLIMGRGKDKNKFDLFDCAGLLSCGEVDIALIRRLIDYQVYKPHLDSRMNNLINNLAGVKMNFEHILTAVEIADKEIEQALLWANDGLELMEISSAENRLLSVDGLKRVAMANRLYQSLCKVCNEADFEYNIKPGFYTSARDAYPMNFVVEEVDRLKTFLVYYIQNIVDRGDLYVSHPTAEHNLERGFFKRLAIQTKKFFDASHHQPREI